MLVGRRVCHNFPEGREVTRQYSFASTLFIYLLMWAPIAPRNCLSFQAQHYSFIKKIVSNKKKYTYYSTSDGVPNTAPSSSFAPPVSPHCHYLSPWCRRGTFVYWCPTTRSTLPYRYVCRYVCWYGCLKSECPKRHAIKMHAQIIYNCLKCNLPMNPYVPLLDGWPIGLSVTISKEVG